MKHKRETADFGGKSPGGFVMRTKPGDTIRATFEGVEVLVTVGKRHVSIFADSDVDIDVVDDEMEIGDFVYEVDDEIFVKMKAGDVREGDEIILNGRTETVRFANKRVKR